MIDHDFCLLHATHDAFLDAWTSVRVRNQNGIGALGRHFGEPLETGRIDIEASSLANLVIDIFGDFNWAQSQQMSGFASTTELRGQNLVDRYFQCLDAIADFARLFLACVRHVSLDRAVVPPIWRLQQIAVLTDGRLSVSHV